MSPETDAAEACLENGWLQEDKNSRDQFIDTAIWNYKHHTVSDVPRLPFCLGRVKQHQHQHKQQLQQQQQHPQLAPSAPRCTEGAAEPFITSPWRLPAQLAQPEIFRACLHRLHLLDVG